jgi:hypothetical protein
VLRNALPFHLAPYVALVAGVTVAVWTATTPGRVYRRPYVLPALAVAALVPALWRTSYPVFRPSHPERLAFFTDADYKSCLPRGGTVVVYPSGNEVPTLLWQAESGFWFRLAAGGLAPVPAKGAPLTSFDRDPFVRESDSRYSRPTLARLLGFVAVHGVGHVLTVPGYGWPTAAQLTSLGPTQSVGGLRVTPGCRAPSLATRNLAGYADAYRTEQSETRPNISWCIKGDYLTIHSGLEPFGLLREARIAIFVQGRGVTCLPPPSGYTQHGYATAAMNVPPGVYPYFRA